MTDQLSTNPKADLTHHLFCIHAAIMLNNDRVLYREAWRLRRLMYDYAGNSERYDYYGREFKAIGRLSSRGAAIVKHIDAVCYTVLGRTAEHQS